MDFGLRGALRRAVVLAVVVVGGPATATAGAAITVTDVTVEEGAPAVFTLKSSNALGEPAAISTKDGTAVAPGDYTAQSRTIAVEGDADGTTVSVPTTAESDVEGDEAFELLVDPTLPGDTATVKATIRNDDAPPLIAVVKAAKENAGKQAIALALVVPTTKTVTVDVETADGSAVAGSDFTATKATITFGPGEQLKELDVPLLDDAVFEGDETFEGRLANARNAALAGTAVKGTITEDDPVPTLTIEGGGPVAEGNEGTQAVGVRLRLSAPSALPAAVAVITERGTATSPNDFTAVQAVVPFAAGETTKDVAVQIKGDDALEPDERFRVLAGSLGGAQTPDGQPVGVTFTIRNDDRDTTPPKATLSAPQLRGSTVRVRVACAAGEELCAGQVAVFRDKTASSDVRRLRRDLRLARPVAYSLAGGKARTITIKPSRTTLALLRRAGRSKVTAYALVADPSKNQRTYQKSSRITVR